MTPFNVTFIVKITPTSLHLFAILCTIVFFNSNVINCNRECGEKYYNVIYYRLSWLCLGKQGIAVTTGTLVGSAGTSNSNNCCQYMVTLLLSFISLIVKLLAIIFSNWITDVFLFVKRGPSLPRRLKLLSNRNWRRWGHVQQDASIFVSLTFA